ncbi:MAG: M20/M25/M40 family metallo-hydrolase, partial [Woeseiaceae bacterium]
MSKPNIGRFSIRLALFCFSCSSVVLVPVSTAETSSHAESGVNQIWASSEFRDAASRLSAARVETNQFMVAVNEIPAPPFSEADRARFVADDFRAMGLPTLIDAAGNVVATIEGRDASRRIAVIAHLDTVFPESTDVTVAIDGVTYRAPGIGDNARGLAMMRSLAKAILESEIDTEASIVFVASVGEEGLGDLSGVRHLFGTPEGRLIEQVIVIDGNQPERIVTTAVGSKRYRVVISGPGGHSFGSFGMVHPHQALALAIVKLTENAGALVAASERKGTFSVGRIGGGTSINSIPFESWMEVDLRSVDPALLVELDNVLQVSVEQAVDAENDRGVTADLLTYVLKPVGDRPAGATAPSSRLIQIALAAWQRVGMQGRLTASSTDANI